MKNNKILMKEKISYGLGDTASNLIFMMITSYLMYFYTDVFGISAAVVGTLFLIARIFDAINDPIIGLFIDKTNTKWGKSRPYFLWFSIPFALLAVLTFYTPDLSMVGKIVYAYITYNLLNVLYSLINLPLSSLLPSITSNTQERTILNSFRMVGGQIGAFLVNLLALPLVRILGQGNEKNGFLFTMLLFALVGIVMYFQTFKNTRERVVPKNNEVLTLKESFSALKKNLPWWIMLFINFSYWVAFTAKNQSAVYYLKYNFNKPDLVSIINGLGVVMIISMIVIPYVTQRTSKRNTMVLGYAIAILGQIIIYISSFGESVSILIIGTIISYLGLGGVNGLIFAAVADTVDYGEKQTGYRAPGLLSSASSFGVKFGMGLGGAIAAWIMSVNGYISKQSNQSLQTLNAIEFDFIWIPLICAILGILSLLFYKVDESNQE
ncbi:MFS transporter [Staphylococcus nepalensis]|uniref:MFS transporter n=1 Tax=Staphylococcus nepalensis TaxID=214473 RepID=UPI003016867B